MQFIGSIFIIFILFHLKLIELAPTDPTADEHEHEQMRAAGGAGPKAHQSPASQTGVVHSPFHHVKDKKSIDYYDYRHVVADGAQKALDECRQKFKWDRWNCPKKTFLSILDREEFSMSQNPLPSNKELAFTRALTAASIVLAMIKSCSIGTNSMCSCTNPTVVPIQQQSAMDHLNHVTTIDHNANSSPMSSIHQAGGLVNPMMAQYGHHHGANFNQPDPMQMIARKKRFVQDELAASGGQQEQAVHPQHLPDHGISGGDSGSQLDASATSNTPTQELTKNDKFAWGGCDELVKLAFKIAKVYLDTQDTLQGAASRLINLHNYEAGRQAVKRNMKQKCKCHGTSGTCQYKTCWTDVPGIAKVGDDLKRQYWVAAKVGAWSAKETDGASLMKELSSISPEKLVFADASPDYCYENKQLGINGTLGRYCSRAKHRSDGTEVGRSERDSCDRLCTKCGYKIKRERINVEKQCDCRFVYCCSVECKRCPHVEETFKCVRHS